MATRPVRRILLLLADTHLRDIFVARFEEAGWETDATADFAEAERKAVRFRPQVFLLDASTVPDVSKTLKHCASLPTLHTAKVMVYGKHLPQDVIVAALKAGAAQVVLAGHVTPQALERQAANLIA